MNTSKGRVQSAHEPRYQERPTAADSAVGTEVACPYCMVEVRSRLAEAERNEETLLGMIRHQRDVLRECLPYINESMAGRRPGRSADDIRAAVKALTSDSASVCLHQIHNGDTCEICGAKVTPVVQPERCCVDYPRCDCNSPPEPDNAPTLQPCGHPWKAQHNFKCILCSSPG